MKSKILRFLELSKEFTIDSEEIFTYQPQNNFIISGHGYGTINSQSEQLNSKTRLELLKEKSEKEVSKAERFEEYLQLQTDLLEYYQALNKLKST
jgi:hypothetical protein